MKTLLTAAACAAALCTAGGAQAVVIDFDDPGVIEIDNDTGIATYAESGYTFSGPAATFLPLESALVAGFDASSTISLKAAGGGVFSLLALDYGFYDFGLGGPPASISMTGLVGGVPVVGLTLALGMLTTDSLGTIFVGVNEVVISGSSGFIIDNVSAVPEPGTWALFGLGLAGLLLGARRQRR